MKKRLLLSIAALSAAAALFVGCGSTNPTNSTEVTTQTSPENFQPDDKFTDGYEEAVYEKFNSLASENGLGGTKIWIKGHANTIDYIEGTSYYTKVSDDQKPWLVILGNDEIQSSTDFKNIPYEKVLICGIYEGFSSNKQMPAMTATKIFNYSNAQIVNAKLGETLETQEWTPPETEAPTTTTVTTTATTTVTENVSIDFSKINDQIKSELPQYYDYLKDVSVELRDDTIYIMAVLNDSTDPALALDMADTLVRQVNMYANMQDSSIKTAGANDYGGLYDRYPALIGIAPLSKTNDSSQWFVNDALASSNIRKISLTDAYK